MTIKEVYEKYLHMDDILSSAITRDFRSTIIRDLWQAINEEVERHDRLEAAIRWALGETDEFPTRQEGQGQYWWRTELRERSGLGWKANEGVNNDPT